MLCYMTAAEARDELLRWREYHGQRDTLIRKAHAAGVTKTDIHRITGIARTTINTILAGARDLRETHYQDATGWHPRHDVYGGPHDEPPQDPS